VTHWTIYDHPRDAPLGYVLRAWETNPEASAVFTCLLSSGSTDLTLLRSTLPPGLVRRPRHPSDDPAILETWV
jgi:hypothetical protein